MQTSDFVEYRIALIRMANHLDKVRAFLSRTRHPMLKEIQACIYLTSELEMMQRDFPQITLPKSDE